MRIAYCNIYAAMIFDLTTLLAIAGFGLEIEGISPIPLQDHIRLKLIGDALPSECEGKTWDDAPLIELWLKKDIERDVGAIVHVSNIRVIASRAQEHWSSGMT